MKKIIVAHLFILLFACATSAGENFIYTRISQKEGLTSTVNSIYKEKDGDVWLGTPNGLYSFNGHTLHIHQDSIFTGRRVFQTSMDKNGDLWVLTNRWPVRKSGKRFEIVKPEGDTSEGYPFLSMCQDDEGIWFGSNSKIFRYTFADSSIYLFKEISAIPAFLVNQIHIVDDHTLICGSQKGLVFIDMLTGEIRNTPFSLFNEVSSILIDSRDRIWISFYNRGIAVFEKDGRLIRRYSTKDSDLSNDVVLCMTERDSSVWVGTDGGGINIIELETGNIRVLSHVAGDPSSFPAHSIKSIYTDDYGNIWAGSIREGLIRISQSGMKTYSDSHIGMDTGLSNPTVLCLYQDPDTDYIWIGTDGEGLNRFDPETGRFTHYPSTLKTKVVSIASYSEDELALSVYADRIWLFNKHTGHIRPLHIEDNGINYLLKYAGRSLNLANGSDGSLLLISNTVSRLDKESGSCRKIGFDIGDKSNGNLLTISSDKEGLWMHDYYNIYLIPKGEPQIVRKGHTNKHRINCGHLDSEGIIWLATDKGLCRFNTADNTFSHVHTTLLQTASSVVCDANSRVWVGTDNGLYAYLKDYGSFTLFGESDGTAPNEFLSKPHMAARNGDVYLGGVQGLLKVDSDYSIDMDDKPLIKLYSLIVDNEEIAPDSKGVCRIPRNSKRIEIGVSSQEKDIFREKVYRFTIPDMGAVYEGKSPLLVLQQLRAPGTHDIMVTCMQRNGEWSEPSRLLTLKIPQPWYFSAWFIICVLIFITLTIMTTHISIARRRDQMFQLAISEQEQKIYEDKVRFLININHELRTPLTLILAPMKRILGAMDPEDIQYPALGRIYRQARRMHDLLDMVLDLRKMEVGKNSLKIETTDFNSWLRNSIEDIVCEELSEGIEIITDLSDEITEVDLDRMRCNTVLVNILMNAVKHSRSGDAIIIRTTLTDDGMVRTSISDQGPGMQDIDPSKLFTRFYQSRNEQYGSGIGLSYSKTLVELHGGRIGAENNPDKGATFWWEIPVSGTDGKIPDKAYLNELLGDDSTDGIEIPEVSSFNTAGKRVMIVDDSQDLLDFLCESMKGDFGEIITANGGDRALRLLTEGELPDIIISDVNMPEGDGYALCSRLKSDERYMHIPIILLTARGEEQSQGDAYKVGADAYMGKPFETETLVELIRNLLRRKENIRKRYLSGEEDPTTDYGASEEAFILKLNAVIAAHLSNPELDQQLLCRELGISRASLFNKMKAITGAGAKEYITRIRIEKAKSLIEASSLPISEISEMTGFASQSYFSTAFKAYTGQTPTQYKKTVHQ